MRSARKENNIFASYPTTNPLALAVNKSPTVYILSRVLDGLRREKRPSVNRLVSRRFAGMSVSISDWLNFLTRSVIGHFLSEQSTDTLLSNHDARNNTIFTFVFPWVFH